MRRSRSYARRSRRSYGRSLFRRARTKIVYLKARRRRRRASGKKDGLLGLGILGIL